MHKTENESKNGTAQKCKLISFSFNQNCSSISSALKSLTRQSVNEEAEIRPDFFLLFAQTNKSFIPTFYRFQEQKNWEEKERKH